MSWPTLQEYNEAIQNPRTAFDDTELRTGKAELGKLGLPRVRTGQFACVYQMQCAKHNWAIRCFNQEVKDQHERYETIDKYISPPLNIPYIVEFNYLSKGISVQGQWYPILTMEWIQGELISEYIVRNLHNPSALRQLAVRWVEMLKVLQAKSIAHGDLQHGNVLVVGDTLKLVDYDGMFVPTLRGQVSHELGHRNYQHPGRTEKEFGPELDNFSAWVIYVSLVALSIDPTLWAKAKAGDECLLFRKSDFDQPLLSPVLALLTGHRDPNIRTVATLFRSMLFFPPNHVPSLDGHVPLATQTDTYGIANQADWWSDHGTVSTQHPVETKIDVHNETSAPAASWILDFVDSPENTKEKFFQSFTVPRIFAGSSGIISIVFLGTVVPYVSSPTLFGDSLDLDILLLFIRTLTFGFMGYLNIMVLVWCYLSDPSVIEKNNLSVRKNKVNDPMVGLEESLRKSEKKKTVLQTEESKQKKELDNALKRLQEQKRRELDDVQVALNKIIISIESRRRTIDQEERDATAKLIASIGYKLNSLKQQISALGKTEVDEIARELAAIQRAYMENYLKGHSTAEAPMPGQYTSRSTLLSALHAHGIYSANDVSSVRVDAVPGFGPKRTLALVLWRQGHWLKAEKLMPRSLSPNVENEIKVRFGRQRNLLALQRDVEQAKFSAEEKAIQDRGRMARQALGVEQSTAQTQASQKIKELEKRYAQESHPPIQAHMQLTTKFSSEYREIDEQIRKIRQEMFGASWQIAKAQHEYEAYRKISFSNYFKVVYFGYRAQ